VVELLRQDRFGFVALKTRKFGISQYSLNSFVNSDF